MKLVHAYNVFVLNRSRHCGLMIENLTVNAPKTISEVVCEVSVTNRRKQNVGT